MNDSTHETEIIVDPKVPLVRIIREFDAPPHKVFRAHTDPALYAQWNGPRGTTMHVDHHDCRIDHHADAYRQPTQRREVCG